MDGASYPARAIIAALPGGLRPGGLASPPCNRITKYVTEVDAVVQNRTGDWDGSEGSHQTDKGLMRLNQT